MKTEFKEKITQLPLKHKWLAALVSAVLAFLIISLFGLILCLLDAMSLKQYLYIGGVLFFLFQYVIFAEWKIKAKKHKDESDFKNH